MADIVADFSFKPMAFVMSSDSAAFSMFSAASACNAEEASSVIAQFAAVFAASFCSTTISSLGVPGNFA